ncbi:MAG: hypothetical protein B7Z51_09470, partial [Methyloversatilis sp. 12-65-5]
MPHSPRARALAALMLLAVIWGYNWVVMKQVIQYVDPFDFSAIRTVLDEDFPLGERMQIGFESGATRLNLDHIHRFAAATNSDPYALILSVVIGSSELARRCA